MLKHNVVYENTVVYVDRKTFSTIFQYWFWRVAHAFRFCGHELPNTVTSCVFVWHRVKIHSLFLTITPQTFKSSNQKVPIKAWIAWHFAVIHDNASLTLQLSHTSIRQLIHVKLSKTSFNYSSTSKKFHGTSMPQLLALMDARTTCHPAFVALTVHHWQAGVRFTTDQIYDRNEKWWQWFCSHPKFMEWLP